MTVMRINYGVQHSRALCLLVLVAHSRALCLLVLVAILQSYRIYSAPLGTPVHSVKGFGSAEHVVIIGTDGLGGVYLENATSFLPNINRFFLEGATTTNGRNKRQCESAPNWGALITGMGPAESGILNNSWLPPHNGTLPDVSPISGAGKIPETMWRVAKNQDSSIVVAVAESWDWIHYLVEDEIVDYEYRCMDQDSHCMPHVLHFIKDECPNLMFFHFQFIDITGHIHTWGSPQYYDAAKVVDGYIGEIMNAFVEAEIFKETLFILVSDHGGYGLNHENFDDNCVRIPLLFLGPKVKRGHTITGYKSITDIAPTALNALGLQPGEYMVGKVLEDIYD